ncbi:hypothetical protein [Aquabacterium humicola]|uniref:hypothetical protein n=1 Tax=Aquabacterium humicola TaxID=3237377 RepID=UPI0025432515|nr:hypothetical protein [Rubrivivax pictus]
MKIDADFDGSANERMQRQARDRHNSTNAWLRQMEMAMLTQPVRPHGADAGTPAPSEDRRPALMHATPAGRSAPQVDASDAAARGQGGREDALAGPDRAVAGRDVPAARAGTGGANDDGAATFHRAGHAADPEQRVRSSASSGEVPDSSENAPGKVAPRSAPIASFESVASIGEGRAASADAPDEVVHQSAPIAARHGHRPDPQTRDMTLTAEARAAMRAEGQADAAVAPRAVQELRAALRAAGMPAARMPAAAASDAAERSAAVSSRTTQADAEPLPERTLHVTRDVDGVHVTIRDGSLSGTAHAAVVSRLLSEFRSAGLNLRSATINGATAYAAWADESIELTSDSFQESADRVSSTAPFDRRPAHERTRHGQ